jgi:hypothetical protein
MLKFFSWSAIALAALTGSLLSLSRRDFRLLLDAASHHDIKDDNTIVCALDWVGASRPLLSTSTAQSGGTVRYNMVLTALGSAAPHMLFARGQHRPLTENNALFLVTMTSTFGTKFENANCDVMGATDSSRRLHARVGDSALCGGGCDTGCLSFKLGTVSFG